MINRMYYGGQSISRVGHDIAEILENTEEFYFAYSQTKKENIYRTLRSYDNFSKQRIKAYMFNYHIKNIGILKTTGDNVVRIKNVEILNWGGLYGIVWLIYR